MNINANSNPLVSICIPAYNGERLIHRALESAIHQSYENVEVIVTDDASTDNTEKIVRRYIIKDDRIKYFRNNLNIGGQKNFLKAVELASGEYIQGLCQDDWLSKNYIEEGIKNFNLYPHIAAVFSSVIHLDLKNKNFSPQNTFIPKTKNYSVDYFFKDGYKSQLASFGGFALYRKRDLINAIPFMLEVLESPSYSKAREANFWGDVLIPLKILGKYRYFVCTSESAYVKVEHFSNCAGQAKIPQDISERVTQSSAIREFYEGIYKKEAKKFFSRFRIDFGTREINNVFVSFLRGKFAGDGFADFIKKGLFFIIKDYSPFEKFLVILNVPLLLFIRFLQFVSRQLRRILKNKKKFTGDYFEFFLNKNNDMTYSFIFENK